MVGTLIRTTRESAGFYPNGALARLVFRDEDGDWWADFNEWADFPLFDNADTRPGVWCVGNGWEVVVEG